MVLYITRECIDGIGAHGERGYPDEVCGLMLGKSVDGEYRVTRLVPVENSFETGEQYHRYLITPEAMFKAERLARQERLDVLGVYHSHPDAPAQPSLYDRDHAAWTAWSYVIVSVREGKVGELRAWRLREDRSGFIEEDLVTLEF
jgi:proteasome lid subunit RPN8/RPN11